MLFGEIAEVSRRVTETSKRNEKIELLAGLLRRLERSEVEIVVDFLSGEPRQGKIGVGWRTLQEAMGAAAAEASLRVADVDAALTRVAEVRGAAKREVLSSLLRKATGAEQQFLAGLLMGELRQGALAGIMLEGVAKASHVNADRLRRAAMMAGDIPAAARAALEQGEAGLTQFDVQLLRPVQPMLAQSAEDAEEAISELGEAALEWKLDGARVQAHKSGDEVVIFSRRLNEVTPAIPEIVEAVRALPVRDLILDGEVISLDEAGRPNPFQVTMRRFGRKLDVEKMRGELPLSPFWFDVLYADGGSLMDEAQARRFAVLSALAPAGAVVPHMVTADAERAREFLKGAIERGH